MKKSLFTFLCVGISYAGFSQILYDNGAAQGGSGIGGIVSPGYAGAGGEPLSVLDSLGGTLGFGHQITADNSVADDYVAPCAFVLDSLQFFAYQTNSTTTSTFTDLRLRIWSGSPTAGGTVVYGDTITNQFTYSVWSGVYRVTTTSLTATTRPIMKLSAHLSTPLSLPAGTYWLEWSAAGTLGSGPWAIPLNSEPMMILGNAKQAIASVWGNAVDGGVGTPQIELPFILYGSQSLPSASSNITDEICGLANGAASITASNGTAPYTYLWNNGDTTSMVDSLMAGTYTVTFTDANGCSNNQSLLINTLAGPTASISSFVDVLCNGDASGEATAMGTGGAGSYTYLWSNGTTDALATGLSVGTYYVTVMDAMNANCADTDTVVIGEPTAISLSAAVSSNYNGSDVTCNGSADGEVTAMGNGGTGMLSYLWSDGQMTGAATGLAAGTYTVTATDVNGCEVISSVVVSEPLVVSLSSAVSSDYNGADISCNGMVYGEATAMGNGGTGMLSYLWSDGQMTDVATDLAAGTYTVTATDVNGCEGISNVTVSEPSVVMVDTNVVNVSTLGGNDGSVALVVSGGTGLYTFVWNNGATTQDISGLIAGTYTVTVTDGNGCVGVQSAVVLDGLVGIANNLIPSNQIAIYPNPAVSFLVVESKDIALDYIVVRNINGQEILRQQAQQDSPIQNIQTNEWSAGVYILTAYSSNGQQFHSKVTKK